MAKAFQPGTAGRGLREERAEEARRVSLEVDDIVGRWRRRAERAVFAGALPLTRRGRGASEKGGKSERGKERRAEDSRPKAMVGEFRRVAARAAGVRRRGHCIRSVWTLSGR